MPRWTKGLQRFGQGAQNALELMRGGRFSAPYRAVYEVADETEFAKLRHYAPDPAVSESIGPLLLVPPLMVTSEIYDISPELSSVAWLRARGVDVWLVDFGSPEQESGGMERTLDNHVLAVDRAVDHVREATGKDVHLAGYSQGGMFVYQCAAYREGAGLASLITFGSPVDIHRNLPAVRDDLASRIIRGARSAVAGPLGQTDGLPGFLTSTGFRLLGAKKEVQQFVELFGILHDRDALELREKRRRFIAGEGFVSWPGPALRTFVDEFVVNNRMTDGGFVINGRTVTLSSLTLPILCFLGGRDEIARPASVRAIRDAAPNAQVSELEVMAGHFGLVVGSRSLAVTWPTVRDWMQWKDGQAEQPEQLRAPLPAILASDAEPEDVSFEDVDVGVEFFYDLASDMVDGVWSRLGTASETVGQTIDVLRWQLPRIAKLRRLSDDSRVSIAQALTEQAHAIPTATFFLWEGRAFTYAQADERVTNVAKGLWMIGVRPGQRVGIVMPNRPTYLVLVAAVSRIGAVSVLFNPDAVGAQLDQAISASSPQVMITDPERAARVHAAFDDSTWVLGGGTEREVVDGVGDMEQLDVATFTFPDDAPIDGGLGGDLAMLTFTSGTTGLPKAARITNRRWALAAIGAAAGCRLTSNDTVYCCLPLHHGTAMLVSVGGGLVGGARLALAPRFSVTGFWDDVHRYGVTVAPRREAEERNPVRVFAGNGMRADVWERLQTRFQPDRIVEFYASTEGIAVLANLRGTKVGSVGRPLPGMKEHALVRFDVETLTFPEDAEGFKQRCTVDEPGVLIARMVAGDPLATFDGYSDDVATRAKIMQNVFEEGDVWFMSGDVMRRDADGDYWFEDRVGDTFRWKGENVSTEMVESVLRGVPGVAMAAAYGIKLPGEEGRAGMAALQLRPGTTLDVSSLYAEVRTNLSPHARPSYLRVVPSLDLTPTFKVRKHDLIEAGLEPGVGDVFALDVAKKTYRLIARGTDEA